MRPNRVQPKVCVCILAEALGTDCAAQITHESGLDQLHDLLPSGPRDLESLSQELQPFVNLYRALQQHTDPDTALSLIRRCIIESGMKYR